MSFQPPKFFTTKSDSLFPTGRPKPTAALVQLKFILPADGGPPLPITTQFVASVLFSTETTSQRQMICDFIEPINSTNGLVKARVHFHGLSFPSTAFIDRNKFKLLAGGRVVAVGVVVNGEPASPPGTRFSAFGT